MHLENLSGVYGLVPKWRAVAGVKWLHKNFGSSPVLNNSCVVKVIVRGSDIDSRTDSYETVELQIGYILADLISVDSASVYVVAKDLFDEGPVFLA